MQSQSNNLLSWLEENWKIGSMIIKMIIQKKISELDQFQAIDAVQISEFKKNMNRMLTSNSKED